MSVNSKLMCGNSRLSEPSGPKFKRQHCELRGPQFECCLCSRISTMPNVFWLCL